MTRLGLAGYKITDISALSECGDITVLLLTSDPVADIWPLSQIENLRFLALADTEITDTEPLTGCSLFYLSLIDITVQDYRVLAQLPELTWLRLSDMDPGELGICGRSIA